MKRAKSTERKDSSGETPQCVISHTPSGLSDYRSQDFAVKCAQLFSEGANTSEIAAIMKKPEYAVYNALARLGR